MRAIFTAFFMVVFLAGCTSTILSTKDISTGLVVKQYDKKFQQYLTQPIKVKLVSLNHGDDYLEIEMISRVSDSESGALNRVVRFLPKHIDDYLRMIDSYLALESSAVSNRLMEDRVLGKIEGYGEGIMFALFSGTNDRHYLALGLSPYSQHYDVRNSVVLKELLIKFKRREL